MPANQMVPEGTVDLTTVQLHELLDVIRRRASAGVAIEPEAAKLMERARGRVTADSIPPDEVRQLAAEMIEDDGVKKNLEPAELVRELRHRVNPVGLAFSGGGIRSASFCLGFLQALATPGSAKIGQAATEPLKPGDTPDKSTPDDQKPTDALANVDFLSTVSGGGYTGGMFSALVQRAQQDAKPGSTTKQNRDRVLDQLTATQKVGSDSQPFWTRLLHRGQAMGALLPFLSRHVANTLVFNLALLGELVFVCCLLAFIWRLLDWAPIHTFIIWSSNGQALEYNRPLIIPLAVFTCYLVVALGRWDCSWWLRVTALSVPMILFGAWLGLPYFIVLTIVLAIYGMSLTLFSGALRRQRSRKQYQETNRVVWASAMMFLVVAVNVVYIAFLVVTVTTGDDEKASRGDLLYVKLMGWTIGLAVVEILWVVYLSRPQFQQNHTRLDKVMLVATGLSVLAGAAVWVSTPNMNFGTSALWSGSQDLMRVAVGAILALLLPFVRLETVLRSGMKAQSSVQRRVFNVLSSVLLLGVPFLLITNLAKHDMSGFAGNLPRDLIVGDVPWELMLRRMDPPAAGTAPAPTEPKAYYEFLRGKLENHRDKSQDPSGRNWPKYLLVPETYVNAQSTDGVYPRWLTSFVEQTNVAIPVDPDPWIDQKKRFQDDVLITQLASQTLRDPEAVLEMLRKSAINSELDRAIKAVKDLPGTDPTTAQKKANARKLEGLLPAARARAFASTFNSKVKSAEEIETAVPARFMAKSVREDLETVGLLTFTVMNYDVPDVRPFGFVSRPVSIERDQTVRLVICGLTFLLFLAALRTVDLNWASPLSFYRRQLREIYLSEPAPADAPPRPLGAGRRNDPPLAALDNVGVGLPYHLIGCSVDVVDRREPRRRLDYFLFSRRYCGAETLKGRHPGEYGFRATDKYCWRDETAPDRAGPVRLADVIAISGAAVTPLRIDNWLMRVVLTVTNFRLGQWLPHPSQNSPVRSTLWNAAQDWPGWDDTMYGNRLVFVADGGFHDNLGLEALLDRRCQKIVVVDAGADPNFVFADLTRVIQRASLYGIELTATGGGPVDLTVLLPRDRKSKDDAGDEAAPTGDPGVAGFLGSLVGAGLPDVGTFGGRLSKAHLVTMEIRYPECGKSAQLIYVKPTFTGDEPTELRTFRKSNPVFPHHSTVEQIFDWTMVDAYRRLGRHIGEQVVPFLFDAAVVPPPAPVNPQAPPKELQEQKPDLLSGLDEKLNTQFDRIRNELGVATTSTATEPTIVNRLADLANQLGGLRSAVDDLRAQQSVALKEKSDDAGNGLTAVELDTLGQLLAAKFDQHDEQLVKRLWEKLQTDPFKEGVAGLIDKLLSRTDDAADHLSGIQQRLAELTAQISAATDAVRAMAQNLDTHLSAGPNGTASAKKKTRPTTN
jgi:hypothetical protein